MKTSKTMNILNILLMSSKPLIPMWWWDAVGGCAVSGGPFKNSYHVLKGVDEILPVDVYIPGCPPRPEAMFYGLMQLQRKVKVEKFFGGVNRQEKREKVFGK